MNQKPFGYIDPQSIAILKADIAHKEAVERGEIKYNTFKVEIDGKDYTNNVVFPIKWEKRLDERLDETRISMKRIKRNIFPPLTPVTITLTDKRGDKVVLNAVITTDESAEVPVGAKTYDHEIMMLEETKILEGIVVDALTFTNALGRSYIKNAVTVLPSQTGSGFTAQTIERVKSPMKTGETFTFPAIAEVFGLSTFVTRNHMKIERNAQEIFYNDETFNANGEKFAGRVTYTSTLEEGKYILTYYAYFAAPIGKDKEVTATYTFYVNEDKKELPRWNIASVIDRVLDLAETHLQGVAPRFKLNSEQHAEFEKIESPEFAFTNSTLKEVLDQIGGYIHGIPRLRGNTIYFDMLGGTEQARLADPKYVNTYVSQLFSQDIESYCTGLDSTVDNMVCLTDPQQGTLTEPYNSGYKTVRTETVYARINEDNMFIATQYPIQEIKNVKCGMIPNENFAGGDITAYVFESAEYARMSGYSEAYPQSKVYALYYTQGTKNIYGLNFRIPKASDEYLGDMAITRILKATSGHDIGGLGTNYPLLSFQVSYIPVFSARTQQTKQYISEYKQPRTLVYNQGANLVETRYFGENMKGAVARMGNVGRIVTYNLGNFALIPEIGQMYGDDYYISGVTCEIYPALLKCMLTLSQDFNRLSQYIGIDSVKRFYEVSEKQAYARNIKYADYVVIGDQVEEDTTCMHAREIAQIFWQNIPVAGGISYTVARTYSESQAPNTEVLLPVISTAQGNAMVFTFNYEDNYSAGVQSQHYSSGEVSGYFTNAVPYADYYGRAEYLSFAMGQVSTRTQSDKAKLDLPQKGENAVSPSTINTGTPGLVIQKDGAEILSVNYILEFVTNRKNYIIGSAMARNSPLVRGVSRNRYASLYILPKRIGKFDNAIDTGAGTKVWDYGPIPQHITVDTKSIKFENFTPAINGAAWAIVDNSTGEILLASNETITAGTPVQMPYMTLRHNIFNIGG